MKPMLMGGRPEPTANWLKSFGATPIFSGSKGVALFIGSSEVTVALSIPILLSLKDPLTPVSSKAFEYSASVAVPKVITSDPLEQAVPSLNRLGFPNRHCSDSTCWLGGGQQGWPGHIRKTCATG